MPDQNFIGIEIGGTKLQLVRANASLEIEKQIVMEVNRTNEAKGILQQMKEAFIKIEEDKTISAVGIGFGGPVNYKTGRIITSHQIKGWDDFDLKEWFRLLTNAPVFVDNDANVAALGEAVHGAGALRTIVFYMTIGSGIGGGVVINKKIYHGAYPGEVEIGHIRLSSNGNTLESHCSGWAVDKRVREAIVANPNSELAKLAIAEDKAGAIFIRPALDKNDEAADKILQETVDAIAFALSHVVHLFHPDVIIIGGGLSLLGGYLSNGIAVALPGYVMQSFLPPPEVKLALLEKNAVPVGALELARSCFNNNQGA